ncbi:MAG: EFR1 family ferrodoxin [bacterium]
MEYKVIPSYHTTIYYFTGTGNSLKIARELARALGETELFSIGRAAHEQCSSTSDAVGIVFPVYAWGPPEIVIRFLDKIKIDSDKYVFAVCTCGGSASGTLVKVKKQLRTRGIALSSGFVIRMPTNYIIWGGALPEEKQQKLFADAEMRIGQISATIKEKKVQEVEMGGLLGRLILTGFIHRLSKGAFAKQDNKFVVGKECNSCGICEKVCQVGNIQMEDGRPRWLHHCEQCLACIHWCPQEAIQVGKKTIGRKRYHHPEVKVRDLM